VGSDDDFDRAIEMQVLAIQLDPHSSTRWRRLGLMHLEKSRREQLRDRHKSVSAAVKAIDSFSAAVLRNPTQALLRAERSEAFHLAGRPDEAQRTLTEALRLDLIKQKAGHVDRVLSQELVRRLKKTILPESSSR
jgi:tetratricopeptide (TPR) repeat protein